MSQPSPWNQSFPESLTECVSWQNCVFQWVCLWLHLSAPSPGLHLGLLTLQLLLGSTLPQLHRGLTVFRLHWSPSFLWFQLGQSMPCFHLDLPLLWLCLIPPSLWLYLGPLSHQLCPGFPSPPSSPQSYEPAAPPTRPVVSSGLCLVFCRPVS